MTELALRLRDVRKAYKSVVAVDGIDLEVRTGECLGLLGPNGAGKTTAMEICAGLTMADAGEVVVLDMQWHRDAAEIRRRLGIQLQETQLAEKLTVVETIGLFRSFFTRRLDASAVIALVQLEDKRNARVGQLSGGQKQRLALACALVGEPDILFLDEPTTGLDPQARRHLWDLVAQLRADGRTIVLTTHYMDEAEQLCDRVAVMNRGKVIALGTPRELIASLGAEHVVEFSVTGQRSTLDLAALARIDGVHGVRTEEDRVRMQVKALHQTLPDLLHELARQGVPLSALRTHSATLDDVFMALTGRQLRGG